ncbi:hypothetical protein AB6N23_14470 [Cellulomonas sp. 179-A 9B4 NHS]|uniref:hypothetical protein n=1 Tax=Cellulomonas sp. 179-A 9B4 NHS TaxID=3142379 RepID=UPI0039A33486
MASSENPHAAADASLRDVEHAVQRLARSLVTPWWYKTAASATVAGLFVGIGMATGSVPFGSATTGELLVVLCAAAAPAALLRALQASTGASVDRYRDGWVVPSLVLIALLAVCWTLQAAAGLPWALLVGAALAFVGTYLYEVRVDRGLRRGRFPAPRAPAP